MLRFFRNIRQKLIEQENVRKYIWYALGEIILVVIGILIALQVNNWNQERLSIKKEIQVLKEFRSELYTDSLSLELTMQVVDETFNVYVKMHDISTGKVSPDSLEKTWVMLRSISFRPSSNISYPDIIKDIIDPKVKLQILQYYDALRSWSDAIDRYNIFIETEMRDFLKDQNLFNYHYFFPDGPNGNPIDITLLAEKLKEKDVQQMIFVSVNETYNFNNYFNTTNISRDRLIKEIDRVIK